MDKKSEPKNDKFITGKMIDCIGNEFDVFLGKNMSIFRYDDVLFIQPPYKYVINDNFLENNRSQSEHGPLNSFFIDKKSEILSFYPINCEIEITSNNGEITLNFINKDKKSLKNTEILILHPWNEIAKKLIQTTIDGKILKITNTTTIADIFKQLKIQNLMPNEIKQPNHKANNSGNTNKSTTHLNKEVLIKKKIEQTNNKTNSIANDIKETNKSTTHLNKEVLIKKEIKQTNNKTENIANDIKETNEPANLNKEVPIKNEIKPDNKTNNIANDIKETNEPANNTSNSLFDEKCCCGFSLNDIKNNLCRCLTQGF